MSNQAAKRIYPELAASQERPARAVAERLGLVQVSDQGRTRPGGWMRCLAAHPGEVARFRGGETQAAWRFFVGQVMKRSKGKADPKGVQPVLQERLGRKR